MKKAVIVFEVLFVLSCILTIVSAACSWGDNVYSMCLGSMWGSLFIKIALRLYIMER